MPFYPGPGLGGHCIPVDPIYLSWRAKLSGFEPRLIDIAQQVNAYMPDHVVGRIAEILNKFKTPLNNSKILIVGISYKKDVKDTRESPALEIISLLKTAGSRMDYHDPYVEKIIIDDKILKSKKVNRRNLAKYDLVCIVAAHTNVDYKLIVKHAKVVFDTRNVLKKFKARRKVFRL